MIITDKVLLFYLWSLQCFCTTLCIAVNNKSFVHTYPDTFKSATFSFRTRLSSTRAYPVYPADKSTRFEFALYSGRFWITLCIRIRVDGNSGYLFIRWRNKSDPGSCCEYCIQYGNLDVCSVTNTPRLNPDTCLVRLDGQILFESGKKKIRKILGYVWSGPKKSNYNFALKERKYEWGTLRKTSARI